MSKRRPKTSWINYLRNWKTAVAAAVCCVVAIGGYAMLHTPESKAGKECEVTRGYINTIDEIKGKSGDINDLGKDANPFVILEIVPWQGYSEFSFYVSGCEPVDMYNTFNAGTLGGFVGPLKAGSSESAVFPEEDYPTKGMTPMSKTDIQAKYPAINDWQYNTYKWTIDDYGQVKQMWFEGGVDTLKGYYEYYDEDATIVKKDAKDDDVVFFVIDGKSNGRPTFKPVTKAEYENGDEDYSSKKKFFWVTCSGEWSSHKEKENLSFKTSDSALDMEAAFNEGDREYTTRRGFVMKTDNNAGDFYCSAKYVPFNDLLRYSLKVHTQYEVDNYKIVVKTAEPQELTAHPEWIDYADMMYMHASSEQLHPEQYFDVAGKRGSFVMDASLSDNQKGATFGCYGSGKHQNVQNEFSFEIAKNIFLKSNHLGKYSGDEVNEDGMMLGYAPVVIGSGLYQGTNGYKTGNINPPTYTLDYTTMTPVKTGGTETATTGYDNNIYKLCLMELLMDQDNFYMYFMDDSSGDPVIQMSGNAGDDPLSRRGLCTAQEGTAAQQYWNQKTFLPNNNAIGNWKAVADLYGIYNGGVPFNTDGNLGIYGYTFVYNNDMNLSSGLGDNSKMKDKTDTDYSHVYDWYRDEQNDDRDGLNAFDVIFYLLNYTKSDTGASGGSKVLRLLEIEPTSSYVVDTKFMQAIFPPKYYKATYKVSYMTSAEFNTVKQDLAALYDVIYIGESAVKLNRSNGDTIYNETRNNGYKYLHVGDTAYGTNANYCYSGNDFTSYSNDNLVKYVKSGHPLLMANNVYNKKVAFNNANVTTLVKSATDAGGSTKVSSVSNAVRNLRDIFVKTASVSFTSTPKQYLKDDDQKTTNKTTPTTKLSFTFKLGGTSDKKESYSTRLYVDVNGDGVLTESTSSDDYVKSSNNDKEYAPGTVDAKGRETTKTYDVSYDIPDNCIEGPVLWKFIVYNNANHSIYYSVSGVSLYRKDTNAPSDENKTVLNVLQVMSDADDTNENLQETNALFNKYKDVGYYQISVKSVTVSEYLKKFETANKEKKDANGYVLPKFEANGESYYCPDDYFNDYDVYVFSAGKELQTADDSDGAASFAAWLVNHDKSVVFTNDGITDAAGVRSSFKDAAALSRYTNKSTRYNDFSSNGAEVKAPSKEIEYTYNKLLQRAKGSSSKYYAFDNDIWKDADGKDAVSYTMGSQTSKEATQSNLGAVCIYPYTIDQDIKVKAHAQDFQLNLNNPNVSVWYSLGNTKNDLNNASKVDNSFYSISPNDGMNNYYLYNVNNVYYDAIQLDKCESEEEMKLFINTLIGVSRASACDPIVNINKVTSRKTGKDVKLEDEGAADSRYKKFNIKENKAATVGQNPKIKIEYNEYVEDKTEVYKNTVQDEVEVNENASAIAEMSFVGETVNVSPKKIYNLYTDSAKQISKVEATLVEGDASLEEPKVSDILQVVNSQVIMTNKYIGIVKLKVFFTNGDVYTYEIDVQTVGEKASALVTVLDISNQIIELQKEDTGANVVVPSTKKYALNTDTASRVLVKKKCSDESVATVDSSGRLVLKDNGSATVTIEIRKDNEDSDADANHKYKYFVYEYVIATVGDNTKVTLNYSAELKYSVDSKNKKYIDLGNSNSAISDISSNMQTVSIADMIRDKHYILSDRDELQTRFSRGYSLGAMSGKIGQEAVKLIPHKEAADYMAFSESSLPRWTQEAQDGDTDVSWTKAISEIRAILNAQFNNYQWTSWAKNPYTVDTFNSVKFYLVPSYNPSYGYALKVSSARIYPVEMNDNTYAVATNQGDTTEQSATTVNRKTVYADIPAMIASDKDENGNRKNYVMTHKIFFTPHDGLQTGAKILRFRLSVMDPDSADEVYHFTKIYRAIPDNPDEFECLKANDKGYFTEEDGNALTDGVEYFVTYSADDLGYSYEDGDDVFKLLHFNIRNEKSYSASHLNLKIKSGKDQEQQAYLFNLD